ncbi:hypothetical protein [Agromyces sp. M3QZ16-3]|uniref:hypothetical protein n=1 Tax=Agromyces sp. M3QZ16-3 TaxID=3447585 RepID=UPI003F691D12
MNKTLVGAAVCAVLVLGSANAAFAGEVGGSGKDTQGPSHANSECSFSGLEDGSEGGTAGPGNVQNWGHTKDSPFVLDAPRGASDVLLVFGQSGCNANLHGMK